MNTHLKTGLVATACLLAFAVAHAESFMDQQIDEKFAAADKNDDGKLTLDEARAGMPRVAANFDKIDTQKRGYVTVDQIKAAGGLGETAGIGSLVKYIKITQRFH